MRNIVCLHLDSHNQINIHVDDIKGIPRLYAVMKVIDGEPRITEVERKDDIYSFYLTMDEVNVILDNWNEMQNQLHDAREEDDYSSMSDNK
jgi:hypothetical protein